MNERNKDIDLLKFVDQKKVTNSYGRQIVLNEIYDEFYGIKYHNDLNRPLSTVALHEQENIEESCLEYRIMKDFANYQIGKYFNISYLEYISLPISSHRIMIKISQKLASKTSKIVSKFNEDLSDI